MKVLIADDHPLVREGLALIVRQWRSDVELCFAGDAAGLLAAAETMGPDLAIVDLTMPGMQGVAGVHALRARCPALALLVVSARDDDATVRAVLAAGAGGFVAKHEAPRAIVAALGSVVAGEMVAPPGTGGSSAAERRPVAASPHPRVALTARQLDVLRELMQGRSNHAIAARLGLAEGTVKIHVAAVLRALKAHNRTEAIVQARALGLPPKA